MIEKQTASIQHSAKRSSGATTQETSSHQHPTESWQRTTRYLLRTSYVLSSWRRSALDRLWPVGRSSLCTLRSALGALLAVSLLPAIAWPACRQENLASRLITPAYAASVDATINYFGHNFFQIITSKGTSIVADPLAPGMYPDPQVSADVVTIGREHMNHNYVPIIRGKPRVLRGLRDFGTDWNQIRINIKDVFIYDVPIYQNGYDASSVKGAAFVFDLGKLCIAHLGDLGHELTAKQLEWIGKVDIALTPISGRWTMGPNTARAVIKQLNPKIAVPMHHRDNMHLVRMFAEGFPVRYFDTNTLRVSKSDLPSSTEIVVLTPPGARRWE